MEKTRNRSADGRSESGSRALKHTNHPIVWLLFLGVCSIRAVSIPSPAAAADGPCIDRIYSKNEPREGPSYQFDIAFDSATKHSRSLSCGPEIRASEAKRALDMFRNGVLYRSVDSIRNVVKFPLRIGVSKSLETREEPEIVTIRNSEEWFAFQDKRLDPMQIALIGCSYLGNVTVESGRSPGFRIGLGVIWFQNSVGSQQVKVTSMNILPVDAKMLVEGCLP